MIFNKEKYNFYCYNMDKICEKMEGDLIYLNTFSIGYYNPSAFFLNKNPNKAKNHKDIMMLFDNNGITYVSGMTMDKFDKYRYQNGIYCKNCDEFIYSVYRHDFRYCKCGKCFVDGGRDYLRCGGEDFGTAKIDFLTDEIGVIQ